MNKGHETLILFQTLYIVENLFFQSGAFNTFTYSYVIYISLNMYR